MIGIYGIKNLTKNKWYIGQSIDVEKRVRSHFNRLNKGNHCSEKLQEDYDNGDDFEAVILEECEIDKLDDMEVRYIEEYDSMKNGYNFLIEDEEQEYQISDKFLDDSKLSWKAKGIYAFIASGIVKNINITQISKYGKDGKTSVAKGFEELVKYGYLTKKENGATNGKFANVSTFKINKGGC